jgi:hypothetical protein
MRVLLATVLAFSLAPAQRDTRGAITAVVAKAQPSVGGYDFEIRGTNPCTAFTIDYGDNSSTKVAIRELPFSVWHHYTRGGSRTIRVTGSDGCGGDATTTINVPLPTSEPTPPQPPPQPPPQGRGNQPPVQQPPAGRGAEPRPAPEQTMRFVDMDRNHDGVITRAEWLGTAQSFATHDWNGDGRLAGDEVRVGAPPPGRGRQGGGSNDWTQQQFRQLDTNRDNQLSRQEWRYRPGRIPAPGPEPRRPSLHGSSWSAPSTRSGAIGSKTLTRTATTGSKPGNGSAVRKHSAGWIATVMAC